MFALAVGLAWSVVPQSVYLFSGAGASAFAAESPEVLVAEAGVVAAGALGVVAPGATGALGIVVGEDVPAAGAVPDGVVGGVDFVSEKAERVVSPNTDWLWFSTLIAPTLSRSPIIVAAAEASALEPASPSPEPDVSAWPGAAGAIPG